ncbi:MAG: ribosome maturation factor RimP [Myxococcales bacterium]
MGSLIKESVVERVRQIAEPLATSMGYEVVEVEYVREQGWVLRLFIDRAGDRTAGPTAEKAGGVTLDDCTSFSHALGPALDVEDFIGSGYALEVSSPGLERPLRRPEDFRRFAGKRAKVKTFAPLRAAEDLPDRKSFSGTLLGVTPDQQVELEVEGRRCRIPLAAIAKAHLVHDFSADSR